MRLILTRHGETIENVEGIIQGHLPGRLSELGKEQVRKLSERLKDEKIDFIYSSDLDRAADTAKEIAKFHPDVPLTFVEELREQHHGEFEGKKRTEVGSERPADSETLEQLYLRAKRFLDSVLHEHANDTVLFVGHGLIGLALICVINNKPPEEIMNEKRLDNTSITIFELTEDKNHKVHVLNCVKHLA